MARHGAGKNCQLPGRARGVRCEPMLGGGIDAMRQSTALQRGNIILYVNYFLERRLILTRYQ